MEEGVRSAGARGEMGVRGETHRMWAPGLRSWATLISKNHDPDDTPCVALIMRYPCTDTGEGGHAARVRRWSEAQASRAGFWYSLRTLMHAAVRLSRLRETTVDRSVVLSVTPVGSPAPSFGLREGRMCVGVGQCVRRK
jgi:hypothetical protein